MTAFAFQTTPAIISRPGATEEIGALIAATGARRVAFVTDKGVRAAGLTAAAEASLEKAGIGVWVFDEVVADPPEALIHDAVARAKAEGAEAVVSVGGGSSMDTAKLIALLIRSDQPLGEIYGVGLAKGARAPLILAPTTAGTGSEVTAISIVTTGEAEKKGVVAPQLYPDYAILDAELTVGLPREVTAATGVDAMVHAIEAYTSKIKKNVISDMLAREALRLLGANIRAACETPEDRDARGAMLTGSMLAGMAFANAPVAAVHALAYPLGGHFHVPHGLSNALVAPHVLCFNMEAAAPLYDEIAPLIFPDLTGDAAPSRAFPDRFAELGVELGMKTRLREVGVTQGDLDMLATDAMKQTRLLVNNPAEMTLEAARAIYAAAL